MKHVGTSLLCKPIQYMYKCFQRFDRFRRDEADLCTSFMVECSLRPDKGNRRSFTTSALFRVFFHVHFQNVGVRFDLAFASFRPISGPNAKLLKSNKESLIVNNQELKPSRFRRSSTRRSAVG